MLQALWLTMLASLLVACGGAIEAAKQQVEISVSVPAEVTIAPGGQLSVSASAISRDDSLTGMSWSIEPVTTPAPVTSTSTPSIVNGDCANKTLTLQGNDGKGNCAVTITVPDQTQPTSWKIMASATATKKGSASKSFLLHVRNPEVVNGNMKVVTQPMVQARSNEITTLTAIANADQPISKLQYRWVQHLDNGQTRLYLAGENSNELRFVPIEVKDLRFTVTATGEINGKLESASADVLVLVGRGTKQIVVEITAPDEQPVVNKLVTLEGKATLEGKELPANAEYRWQLISPKDSELVEPPVLNNLNSQKLNFMPKQRGTYVFKLTVSVLINGQYYTGESVTERLVAPARSTCGFTVTCEVPAKGEGINKTTITRGESVSLKAVPGASSEEEGCAGMASVSSVSYKWTAAPEIPGIDKNIDSAIVTGTPDKAVKYSVIVTASPVVNGYMINAAASDSCLVEVLDGVKLVVDAYPIGGLTVGDPGVLRVKLSTDKGIPVQSGALCKWEQMPPSPEVFSGFPKEVDCSLDVAFTPTRAGQYKFKVTVSGAKTDEANPRVLVSSPKEVTVDVKDKVVPKLTITLDPASTNINLGGKAVLTATLKTDTGVGVTGGTYTWSCVPNNPGALVGSGASANFTPTVADTYTCMVKVSGAKTGDGILLADSPSNTVTVTVK